jgi:vacuolar-type H+-ATPase subunit I/STV1
MIGFLLVVGQLARVQRQEFGWPRFVLRSWGWTKARLRQLLRRPGRVHGVGASMLASIESAARASVRKGMGPQAFDRFAAIEYNLTEIEKELRERIGEVNESVRKLREELTTTRSTIEQREREREEERKAELRSSLAWEAWGVVFFLTGTVLSVLGSVTTC